MFVVLGACGGPVNVGGPQDDAGSGANSSISGAGNMGSSSGAGTMGSSSGLASSGSSSGSASRGSSSGFASSGDSGTGAAAVDSGGATSDSGGDSGSGGSADAGSVGGPAPTPVPGNSLMGTLGTLGPAKPIVASHAITTYCGATPCIKANSQVRIYLSSAPLTCAQMMTAGWLQSATDGSQVVEIVVSGLSAGFYPIGAAAGPFNVVAVNYAAGGTPSTAEVTATSGGIVVNAVSLGPDPLQRGTVDATFADGSKLAGTFLARFCAGGGQHY
jgi:hypothetical protein